MGEKADSSKKGPAESLGEMFEALGGAIGEILKDPELKEKAKEFGRSARDSADAFAGRLHDEEVKARFREVGKAAEQFGKSLGEFFSDDKER